MLGASMVQVHISDAVGSVPNKQALSVVPAEIIKMLALVVCIPAWQKCNDELTINRSNAGNRTENGRCYALDFAICVAES